MNALGFAQQHLPALALTLLRLCVWLLLLSVVFLPLERLFALRHQKVLRKAFWTDIGYYFLSGLAPGVLLATPLALLGWGVHKIVPGGLLAAITDWPVWMRIIGALVVGEIGFYWGHRWSHEIPLLWRFHAIHHSAEHVDWLVNTRAHPVDMVFTRLCGLVPLYALGLGAPLNGSASVIPALVILLGTIWGFFIHANVRWRFGPLEWLVATPAFHHWHHTNDGPEYINKNYAPMFPLIDRFFGTLYLPRRKRPSRYGIDQTVPPSLLGQLLSPTMIALPTSHPKAAEAAQSTITQPETALGDKVAH